MNKWSTSLEWYYFGDLYCLCSGGNNQSEKIIDDLMGLEPKKLAKELNAESEIDAGTGPANASPQGLLGRIRSETRSRGHSQWTEAWPPELKLKVGHVESGSAGGGGARENEVIVGPGLVVLPWPFSADRGSELKAKAKQGGFQPSTYKFNGETDFYADAVFRTADKLVDGDLVGEMQRWLDAGKKAKDAIEHYASAELGRSYIRMPENMEVIVEKEMFTECTYLEYTDSHFKLVLGLEQRGGRQHGFREWPCESVQ